MAALPGVASDSSKPLPSEPFRRPINARPACSGDIRLPQPNLVPKSRFQLHQGASFPHRASALLLPDNAYSDFTLLFTSEFWKPCIQQASIEVGATQVKAALRTSQLAVVLLQLGRTVRANAGSVSRCPLRNGPAWGRRPIPWLSGVLSRARQTSEPH